MRFEHEGLQLWYGTPDAPAPDETVEADAAATVTVAVWPADVSNQVAVIYRINGGATQRKVAAWWRNGSSGIQYFGARLGPFRPGDLVEYAATCHCAGRQVPAKHEGERLSSSFRVMNGEKTPSVALVSNPSAGMRLDAEPATAGASSLTASAIKPRIELQARADAPSIRVHVIEVSGVRATSDSVDVTLPQPGSRFQVQGTFGSHSTERPSVSVRIDGTSCPVSIAPNPDDLPGASGDWTCNAPPVYRPGTRKIDAHASARTKRIVGGEELLGPEIAAEDSAKINIRLTRATPDLDIAQPRPGHRVLVGDPSVVLKAYTKDGFGRRTIRWELDGRSGTASLTPTDKAGFQRHEATISVASSAVEQRTLVVRCVQSDAPEIQTTQQVTFSVSDWVAPTLHIDEPQTGQAFIKDKRPVEVVVRGTATDAQSGMAGGRVEWSLDKKKFSNATTTNGWRNWEATALVDGLGRHTIYVRATDKAGNSIVKEISVELITAGARDLADRLSARAYLEALLAYAHDRVTVDAAKLTNLTSGVLEDMFRQPFGPLSQPLPDFGDLGDRPVNQLRIVAEVLRRYLARRPAAGTLPDGEARYRQAAYQALLAGMGTSHQELRLMRGAEPSVRKALADRLGIVLSSDAPDELDQLTLDGATLTEERLEQLFGLRDTGIAKDPLRPSVTPLVLQWRETHLDYLWAEQDHAGDVAHRPFPVLVDPDLIGPDDLANSTGGPAQLLVEARRQEVAGYVAKLDELRKAAKTAAKAFNALLANALPDIDLAALDAQRREGEDITAQLQDFDLTRPGFDYLLRISLLVKSETTVLEAEWEDVRDILTQVKKARRYPQWRADETTITLSPDHFTVSSSAPPLPKYRASGRVREEWQAVLQSRIDDRRALREAFDALVDMAEELALPTLRDALVLAVPQKVEDKAEWLTEQLQIDVKVSGALKTTRILQAVETLQSLLFSLRAGRLATSHPAYSWTINSGVLGIPIFDMEWAWIGTYESWRAAMSVFLYPENTLFPTLYSRNTSKAFPNLLGKLRKQPRLAPPDARTIAAEYLDEVRPKLPDLQGKLENFKFDERLTETELDARRTLSEELHKSAGGRSAIPEIFYFVPMQLALRLQASGEYLAALDWFHTVYAYSLPPGKREIYYELVVERLELEKGEAPNLRPAEYWLLNLNPHSIAGSRPCPYTRFTLISLARCCLEFADAEFTRDTIESIAHARALYVTARDLLALPALKPVPSTDKTAEKEFPNPTVEALQTRVETQLAKLRQGRNIAGMKRAIELPGSPTAAGSSLVGAQPPRLPTPYHYRVLIERTKQLVALAQQIEAEYLSALEKFDQAAYRRFEANQALDLAQAGVKLQALRVQEADRGIVLARRQKGRADFLAGEYQRMIDAGLSEHEQAMLDGYRSGGALRNSLIMIEGAIAMAQTAMAADDGGLFGLGIGAALAPAVMALQQTQTAGQLRLNTLETKLQSDTLLASHERQVEEWRLQQGLAQQDASIAAEQILLAQNQRAIVGQEQVIARMQANQAQATVEFLDRQFTGVDLYEWMSEVLAGVYRYFLQTATAMARLAQDQLAFERQEPSAGFVGVDYWQPPAEWSAGGGASPDRRGLTGSARLLQDLYQLDQYAFQTDRRKLNLSQTFSLAQRAPLEFQVFRDTGALRFATPMQWFNEDFPGHYLRLIKRVRTSLVALVPPGRGIRATLTASGLSRVVAGGDTFRELVMRRDPERVALTSPVAATGVFDLDAQPDLLGPFEAMGVDTSWELELPRAANPFDFGSIADVLITIEYTALHSDDYR